MHIGQTPIDAVAAECELCMVDTHEVQYRGVDIIDLSRVVSIQWLVAPLIRRAVRNAGLDAAAA